MTVENDFLGTMLVALCDDEMDAAAMAHIGAWQSSCLAVHLGVNEARWGMTSRPRYFSRRASWQAFKSSPKTLPAKEA
jgi:hypothetical protein